GHYWSSSRIKGSAESWEETHRRLEARPQAVAATAGSSSRSPGSTRYSLPCWSSNAVVVPLSAGSAGSGGDEETRTPDPLLAKEMLSQLSYVPRTLAASGGRWWAFLDSNQRPLPYQGSALT